jgi:glycine/D-amino acid oxidase-like deaminating enzyme
MGAASSRPRGERALANSVADEHSGSEGAGAELPAEASVVIVGGGIAGLASAWHLAELGMPNVLLIEAEPALATHSSGRNAGIFLPLEENPTAIWLAARSRDLLDSRIGTSWLSAQGVALVAKSTEALEELRFGARRLGVYHERWSGEEVTNKLPHLRDGECTEALHLPLAGVIDNRLMLARMRRWAVASGVRIVADRRVSAIDVQEGQVTGVQLEQGGVRCERVVLAAGAFAGALGKAAGSQLSLTPLRRNLVLLKGPALPSWKTPVVWRMDAPIYFRPEAGGLLASPCDEHAAEPGLPDPDDSALESVLTQLKLLAPTLTEDVQLDRGWACLRTVTSDRELAVGADPQVRGLHWCAGLGGRGMTVGAAAGELLARTMLGLSHPLARPLALDRFG